MPQIIMPYTVHLDHTLRVTPLSTLFAKGDSAAHRFVLTILSAGVQEDLTGCTVMCKFYRMADSTVVSVTGSVEDGKAVAVLKKACYDYIGRFALTIAIQKGEGEETTVFYGDGYMHGQRADTAISGEYIIYDINTLLEKIKEIEAATKAANTATANANTATGKANTAASAANTAATNANAAADAANAAAKDWGDSTAANSYKLGGKAPEYYIQLVNLLDNSDFRNPVNQRGATSYATAGYSIDRWRIADSMTLTDRGGCIEITNSSSGGRKSIEQIIPNNYVGKTLTVAICEHQTGSIYCRSVVIPGANGSNQYLDSADFDGNSARLALLSSGDLVYQILVKANGNAKLRWAALYEGAYTADTLPPYVPKGYAAELMECQRYCYAISIGNAALSFHGYFQSTTEARLTIPIGTRMRVTPTIVFGDISQIRIYGNGTTAVPSEATGCVVSGSAVTVTLSGFDNGVTGEAVAKINTTFIISADL